MHLRTFRETDVAAMYRLFHDTVHRVNSRDYTAAQVAAWAPAELEAEAVARWVALFSGSTTVLACSGDELLGYCNLESNGHLDHFYVSADHQRQWIGSRLITELDGHAARAGLTEVFAEVSITARGFFERSGFRVVGERHAVARGVSFLNYDMRTS